MSRYEAEWSEQRRLWRRWLSTGEPECRAALIDSYLPMVRGIIRRAFRPYHFRWCIVEDVQQAATVRLVELFDTWEPAGADDPTTAFLNYAYVALSRSVRRERNRLLSEYHDRPLSLDEPLTGPDDDGRLIVLGDTVAAPGADPLERLLAEPNSPEPENRLQRFLLALQCLGKRDRQLVELLFVQDMSIRRARTLLGSSDQALRRERDRVLLRLKRVAEGARHA